MTSQHEDRRTRRTNNLLKQGLCELLKEKEISDITIKELTDRVDLNRRTFYLHYEDIYDLLEKMADDFINDTISIFSNAFPFNNEQTLKLLFDELLHYVSEHFDISRTLFKQPNTKFILKHLNALADCFSPYIHQSDRPDNFALYQYTSIFFCYGILGILSTWLNEETPRSISEVSNFLYSAVCKGYTASSFSPSVKHE